MPSTNGRTQPAARLLVVEDEPNILELLSASLRYAGFDVLTASNWLVIEAGTVRVPVPAVVEQLKPT